MIRDTWLLLLLLCYSSRKVHVLTVCALTRLPLQRPLLEETLCLSRVEVAS